MKKLIFLSLIVFLGTVPGMAKDRKVTPVENTDNKPEKPILHYYDRKGNLLAEPVYVLVEEDTVARPGSGPVYPKLNSVSTGVNIMDAVMMLAGQKYSSFDIWADISLYNWIFPTVEIGFGRADSSPAGGNFTYKCSPSVYVKAGADYNFLYKSNSDYRAFLGLRAGFSSFSYSVDNISISSGYWDQIQQLSLKDQKGCAFYGQVLAGIKVKVFRNFSMGWTLRYNFKFHVKDGKSSSPWFIPGYGSVDSPVTATFSLIYTFPFRNGKSAPDSGI